MLKCFALFSNIVLVCAICTASPLSELVEKRTAIIGKKINVVHPDLEIFVTIDGLKYISRIDESTGESLYLRNEDFDDNGKWGEQIRVKDSVVVSIDFFGDGRSYAAAKNTIKSLVSTFGSPKFEKDQNFMNPNSQPDSTRCYLSTFSLETSSLFVNFTFSGISNTVNAETYQLKLTQKKHERRIESDILVSVKTSKSETESITGDFVRTFYLYLDLTAGYLLNDSFVRTDKLTSVSDVFFVFSNSEFRSTWTFNRLNGQVIYSQVRNDSTFKAYGTYAILDRAKKLM